MGGAFILIFLRVLVFLSGSVIGSSLGGVTKGVVLGGTNDFVFNFAISCDIALFFFLASLIKSSKDLPSIFFDDFALLSISFWYSVLISLSTLVLFPPYFWFIL